MKPSKTTQKQAESCPHDAGTVVAVMPTANNVPQYRHHCRACGFRISNNISYKEAAKYKPFASQADISKISRRFVIQKFGELAKQKEWWSANGGYEAYLQSEQWQQTKSMALKRDRGMCRLCGDAAMDVHHVSYETIFCESVNHIISLCRKCHKLCHMHVAVAASAKELVEKRIYFDDRRTLKNPSEDANMTTGVVSKHEIHSKLDNSKFLKAGREYRLSYCDALIELANQVGARLLVCDGKLIIENESYLPNQAAQNIWAISDLIVRKLSPAAVPEKTGSAAKDSYSHGDFVWHGSKKGTGSKCVRRKKHMLRVSISTSAKSGSANIVTVNEQLLGWAKIPSDGRVEIGNYMVGDKTILALRRVESGGYKLSKAGKGHRKIQFGTDEKNKLIYDRKYFGVEETKTLLGDGAFCCELAESQP